MMDSQIVHLTGCTLSVRLRNGMGVGATSAAWGGSTLFLRQAHDGESRHGRDRPYRKLEETFYEVVK